MVRAGEHGRNPSISDDGRFIAYSSIENFDHAQILLYDRQNDTTTIVSKAANGDLGNQTSSNPSISADGQIIVFESVANNFVVGDDNSPPDVDSFDPDIFAYDRESGELRLVSVNTEEQSIHSARNPSLSANGRFVAFNDLEIFLHDLQYEMRAPTPTPTVTPTPPATTPTPTNTPAPLPDDSDFQIELVSKNSNGVQGNKASQDPSISANGRFVAFQSDASNLVDIETNGNNHIYVHDRQSNVTELISVNSDGEPANNTSYTVLGGFNPSVISADGRYVTFYSAATNLVEGDTNEATDVFVHDRQTGETIRVSVDSNGNQSNGNSVDPIISGNGRFVVFSTVASNLVENDYNTNDDGLLPFNLFLLHDLETGETTDIRITNSGEKIDGAVRTASISFDGRFLAFEILNDIIVQDRQKDTVFRLSESVDIPIFDVDANKPFISDDGRFVAFTSTSSVLVDSDPNPNEDVFLLDLQTGEITHISNTNPNNRIYSQNPSISGDGRFVVFQSSDDSLVEGDTNEREDIFVYDRITEQIKRVNINENGVEAEFGSTEASISANGQQVAFQKFDNFSDIFLEGDINRETDIFVYDTQVQNMEPVPTLAPIPSDTPRPTNTPTPIRTPAPLLYTYHSLSAVTKSGSKLHIKFDIRAESLAVSEFSLTFEHDPSILQANDLSLTFSGESLIGNFENFSLDASTPGQFTVSASNGTEPVLIDGDELLFFRIEFELTGKVGTTRLFLANRTGDLEGIEWNGGTISTVEGNTTPTPTPTPLPTVSFEPELLTAFEFDQSSLAASGWSEIPGGFEGAEAGNIVQGSIPESMIPNSADNKGLKLTVAPGQITFIHAAEAVDTGGDPVLIRVTAQAEGAGAALALVALKGSIATGENLDGSIASLIPANTQSFIEQEKRMVILYQPDSGTIFSPAIQLASQNENEPVSVYIDKLEVIKLNQDFFSSTP